MDNVHLIKTGTSFLGGSRDTLTETGLCLKNYFYTEVHKNEEKKDDNIDFKFQNSDKKPTKSMTTISWLSYSK